MKKVKNTASIVVFLLFGCCSIDLTNSQDADPDIFDRQHWIFDETGANGNLFDIYTPKSEYPTPLIIAIHGGAFVDGDKSNMTPPKLNKNFPGKWINQIDLYANSFAFASINYSLVSSETSYGIEQPLNDIKAQILYLKENAALYNVDTNNIYLFGSSAGATSALWVGLQMDGIKGIIAFDPQASLNYGIWGNEIYKPYGYKKFYKTQSKKETFTELSKMLYKNKSVCKNMNLHFTDFISEHSPEIFLVNTGGNTQYLHHISHTLYIRDKAWQKGANAKINNAEGNHFQSPGWESITDFCLRKTYWDNTNLIEEEIRTDFTIWK